MALSLFGNGRSNSLWEPLAFRPGAWDPFELIDNSLSTTLGQSARSIAGTKIDWVEREDAHVIKADLPGLKKEDIKVELENDRTLQISGERSQGEEKKGDTWHTVERSHGKFMRRFRLPEDSQTEAVTAKVENGVLTVTIPKNQVKAPEKKTIQVA